MNGAATPCSSRATSRPFGAMKQASLTDSPSAVLSDRSAASTSRTARVCEAMVFTRGPGALNTPRQTGLEALTRMIARCREK